MKWTATLLLLTLVSCSRELKIESATSWSAFVGGDGGYSLDGSGNHSEKLDAGTVCWTVQKETEQGTLRAYAEETGIFGGARMGEASTSAAYGVVTGCTE